MFLFKKFGGERIKIRAKKMKESIICSISLSGNNLKFHSLLEHKGPACSPLSHADSLCLHGQVFFV